MEVLAFPIVANSGAYSGSKGSLRIRGYLGGLSGSIGSCHSDSKGSDKQRWYF